MKKLFLLLLTLPFIFYSCDSDDNKEDIRTLVWVVTKEKNTINNEVKTIQSVSYMFNADDFNFLATQDLTDYMMGYAVAENGNKVVAKYNVSATDNLDYNIHTEEGRYFVVTYIKNDTERFRYTTFYINVKKGQSKKCTVIFPSNSRFYMESNNENTTIQTS